MKEEFKTLSDTLYEGKWCHITHLKEFIKETIEDVEGGYEGVELIDRIKNRAGEKLIK